MKTLTCPALLVLSAFLAACGDQAVPGVPQDVPIDIKLSGNTYEDLNGNGQRDLDEPGLPGFTFQIGKLDNSYMENAVVNKDGGFSKSFPNAFLGSKMEIKLTSAPTGAIATGNSLAVGGTYSKTLTKTEEALPAFGYGFVSTVTLLVFEDKDASAGYNTGDAILEGVKVRYTDSQGKTGEAHTDAGGKIVLADVPPGKLKLILDQRTLPKGVGTETTGTSEREIFVRSRANFGVAFGYNYKPSTDIKLSGSTYEDLNGNGQRDLDEPGLPGFTFQISKTDNSYMGTAAVNNDGEFSKFFPNTFLGSEMAIKLTSAPTGAIATGNSLAVGKTYTKTFTTGGEVLPAFGYGFASTVTLLVFEDKDFTAGYNTGDKTLDKVKVRYTDSQGKTGEALTDAGGRIVLADVPPGKLKLMLDKGTLPKGKAAETTGTSEREIFVRSRANFGVAFGYSYQRTVKGILFEDKDGNGLQNGVEVGVPNVSISATRMGTNSTRTVKTDAQGRYRFEGMDAGMTRISVDETTLPESLKPFKRTTKSVDGSEMGDVEDGELEISFGYVQQPKLKILFFDDQNGDAKRDPGETVFKAAPYWNTPLYQGQGMLNSNFGKNFRADSNGLFELVWPDAQQEVRLEISEYAFLNYQRKGGFYANYAGATGQRITGTSNPNVTVIPHEVRLAMSVQPKAVFDQTVEVGVTDKVSGQGRVYDDIDGNGKQDLGELGLKDVVLYCKYEDSTAKATTDANGNFSFSLFSTFKIDPATGARIGTEGLDDCSGRGQRLHVDLGSLQGDWKAFKQPAQIEIKHQVFAFLGLYLPRGSVQGHLFEDSNTNKQMEDIEPRLGGVTVTLTDASGQRRVTKTEADGSYSFPNVVAGQAKISIDEASVPAKYQPLKPTVGDLPYTVNVLDKKVSGETKVPALGFEKNLP